MQASRAALLRLIAAGADHPYRPHLHARRRSWPIGCVIRLADCKAPDAVTCDPLEPEKHKLQIEEKPRDMIEMIDSIRAALQAIGDGEITTSAYDTAWVALVKNIDGGDGPQFPSCIDWIVQNQMPDGSWGDKRYFLVQDRLISTLACTIALKSWNIHHDKCKKGMSFIHENLSRLTEADEDLMLVGFEITFPALLEMAKNLRLDMPFDEPTLQIIYGKRDQKLSKIPKDLLHVEPTTLLLSLEGMRNLDWGRLLKLQNADGSFMLSPAPTAYSLMQTGDKKCLKFLDEVAHKFNGGVPFVYPVDLFERLWVVDRLERLGISRYFTNEIVECLDYAYRHWSPQGLSFARDYAVNDIDDTAMAFRLLRLHGYHVSPGVFRHFETDGGEFLCYPRQTNQSVTAVYNLNRATQVPFSGEDELQRASSYSRAFLEERRASGKLNDKWVIAKDLPGEVRYTLDFPWRASLPRIETRMYLEQYGGSADVWIGKVLYRMPTINNDMFLEAAKADFSSFQRICQLEWHGLKKWFDKNELQVFGVTSERALRAYFLAAANVFEPHRATERLAWTRTWVVAEAVSWHLQGYCCNGSKMERLLYKLENHGRNEPIRCREEEDWDEKALLRALSEVLNLAVDDNASNDIREAWMQWLRSWTAKESSESCEGSTALLLARTLEIYSGRHRLTKKDLDVSKYYNLERLTSSICTKLASRVLDQSGVDTKNVENADREMESEMQEFTQCALQSCSCVSKLTGQTFLSVVKSFYYVAHTSPDTIDSHISKVIFEDVV